MKNKVILTLLLSFFVICFSYLKTEELNWQGICNVEYQEDYNGGEIITLLHVLGLMVKVWIVNAPSGAAVIDDVALTYLRDIDEVQEELAQEIFCIVENIRYGYYDLPPDAVLLKRLIYIGEKGVLTREIQVLCSSSCDLYCLLGEVMAIIEKKIDEELLVVIEEMLGGSIDQEEECKGVSTIKKKRRHFSPTSIFRFFAHSCFQIGQFMGIVGPEKQAALNLFGLAFNLAAKVTDRRKKEEEDGTLVVEEVEPQIGGMSQEDFSAHIVLLIKALHQLREAQKDGGLQELKMPLFFEDSNNCFGISQEVFRGIGHSETFRFYMHDVLVCTVVEMRSMLRDVHACLSKTNVVCV